MMFTAHESVHIAHDYHRRRLLSERFWQDLEYHAQPAFDQSQHGCSPKTSHVQLQEEGQGLTDSFNPLWVGLSILLQVCLKCLCCLLQLLQHCKLPRFLLLCISSLSSRMHLSCVVRWPHARMWLKPMKALMLDPVIDHVYIHLLICMLRQGLKSTRCKVWQVLHAHGRMLSSCNYCGQAPAESSCKSFVTLQPLKL